MSATMIETLRKNVGKKAVKSHLYVWLADLERQAGNAERALELLEKGSAAFPGEEGVELVRSAVLFDLGRLDEALAACENVLKKDPCCLTALRRKGAIHEQQGDEVGRNKCFRLVHDLDPLDPFWKEEYGVVPEPEPEPDEDELFLMDDLSLDEESMELPADEPSLSELAGALVNEELADVAPMEIPEEITEVSKPEAAASEDDGASALELESLLDDALAASVAEVSDREQLNREKDEISEEDISSAIAGMFGGEPDERDVSKPLSPFAAKPVPKPAPDIEIPQSLDDDFLDEKPKRPAEAEAPTSLDDAFGDIFGEDELPEEKPSPKKADEPTTLDDAFGDIFGEDELPEEKPLMFQKSAEAPAAKGASELDDAFGDLLGEDELPEEKPSMFQKSVEAPAAKGASELDDAFGDLLGEDELPEEKPSMFQKSAESADTEVEEELGSEFADLLKAGDALPDDGTSVSDLASALDAPEEQPAAPVAAATEQAEPSVDDAFASMFGEDDSLDEAPAATKPAEPSVDDAFASMFGEDDSLDEAPAATKPAEPSVDDAFASMFGEDDSLDEAPAAAKPAEPSVDDAFASMFGEDDSLDEAPAANEVPGLQNSYAEMFKENASAEVSPFQKPLDELPDDEDESLDDLLGTAEPKPQVPAAKEEPGMADALGSAVDELLGDDEDLTLPKAQPAKQEGSAEDDLNSSFNKLFGEDDDLELPSLLKSEIDDTVLPPLSSEAAQPEERTSAFQSLFSMEDELPEENAAKDKVDFLMSGDSDDEISAALLKDPSKSLGGNSEAIDDRLNTKTLGEIYFEQGHYAEAVDIYKGLAEKYPDDKQIAKRLAEIKKVFKEKYGQGEI